MIMSPFEGYVLLKEGSESRLREALHSNKLDPNARFRKESFLAYAIKLNGQHLLRLLLEHGADPNLVSYENGRCEPAVITATRYKSFSSVQLLLQFGANPRKTNFYGTDVIFQAVHENAVEILDYILEDRQQGICLRGEAEACSKAERDCTREHLLCPFNYALSRSHTSHGKRQTLLRLIQSHYQCRCLSELLSNQRITTTTTTSSLPSKMHRAKHEKRGTKGDVLYRIYEIRCNWDEESGATARTPKRSYIALMGPLKLSYLAREVIREHLCTRSPIPIQSTCGLHKANTFRRSLNALDKALPRSLTNFIAYRNIAELSSEDVQVMPMEIDGVPNVSFTVISF